MNFFGKQIEQERKIAKLSILELSQKTGLSEEVLTNIETGKLFPDVRHLMVISKALGKHQGHFFTQIVHKK